MPYLAFESNKRALGPGVLTIGSGTEAAWRVQDRDLAPLHAIVTLERDGRLSVESIGAPIVVNGSEMQDPRTLLSYGDTMRLGGAEFRFIKTVVDRTAEAGYLYDTRRGRYYHLGDVTEIGRDVRCNVLVQEPDVSRVHAEVLRREGGGFLAKPVGGAYTLVNAHRLMQPSPLKEGDELTVGRTTLRFTAEPPARAIEDKGQHVLASKRAAKMQTVYMGSLQARERVDDRERKKYGTIVALVAGTVIVIGYIVMRLVAGV
ncbi:MAG: hypothetical protein NVS1B4_26880 [Gemmatimonadaceae bacterium]